MEIVNTSIDQTNIVARTETVRDFFNDLKYYENYVNTSEIDDKQLISDTQDAVKTAQTQAHIYLSLNDRNNDKKKDSNKESSKESNKKESVNNYEDLLTNLIESYYQAIFLVMRVSAKDKRKLNNISMTVYAYVIAVECGYINLEEELKVLKTKKNDLNKLNLLKNKAVDDYLEIKKAFATRSKDVEDENLQTEEDLPSHIKTMDLKIINDCEDFIRMYVNNLEEELSNFYTEKV